MMKIVASLVILGLCANVAFGDTVAIAGTSQGTNLVGLNSTAQKVYVASNTTDASFWNPTVAGTGTDPSGIPYSQIVFGPGASNDTSYVYGYAYTTPSSQQQITTIVVRTLNNTIVAYGNDTTNVQPFTKSTTKITPSIIATSATTAVGPGYLAILSTGSDGTNQQVYYTLVSGTTASPVKITSTADVAAAAATAAIACTATTFTLGNIWYDKGLSAFFYTYSKRVNTYALGGAASCGSSSSGNTVVNTIYVGGVYSNGTVVLTTPLALATANPANSPQYIVGGGDNWLNATNIYVVYKDTAVSTSATGANAATGIIYQQKITKSATATAGTFTALVSDTVSGTFTGSGPYTATSSVVTVENIPVSVWASNFTYGIAVSNSTSTQTATQYNDDTDVTPVYTVSNYLNSTLTWADSGITYSSAVSPGYVYGWQLNTGYTLIAQWVSSTSSTPTNTYAYTWGTFYGNGTVNATASTLGTVQGPVSFYEDVNGTAWVGWTDVETANTDDTMTYAGYLAKLQGQLNVPSGASILSALSAFALFLAAIFVF